LKNIRFYCLAFRPVGCWFDAFHHIEMWVGWGSGIFWPSLACIPQQRPADCMRKETQVFIFVDFGLVECNYFIDK
jgi:hypothetical protein